jgi:hypothetical protein
MSGSEIGFLLGDAKRKADKAKGSEAKDIEINAKGSEAKGFEINPKGKEDKGPEINADSSTINPKGEDPFNPEILNRAIASAKGNRKTISVWSPLISATMWYLKSTTPLFSISDVTKEWIEEAMRREHPELVKKIEEELEKSN